jgi:hypothetical protein
MPDLGLAASAITKFLSALEIESANFLFVLLRDEGTHSPTFVYRYKESSSMRKSAKHVLF